jgi:endonuclease/exonuclease/phosphatase family metal-dependent hydrolase
MRSTPSLIVALWGCACSPPLVVAPPDAPSWTRIDDMAQPDVTTDRLCVGSEDPESLTDTTFLDCTTETFRFAEDTPDDTPLAHGLVVMAFNMERGRHLDAILDAFDRGDLPLPDVLLASELDRGCERSGNRHIAYELGAHLGMDVAFGVEFVELPAEAGPGRCEHGNALFSRYPLGNAISNFHADNVSWYIPPDERPGDEPRLGGRSFVQGDVQLGDTSLRAVSVHFESRPSGWESTLPAQATEAALAGLGGLPLALVGGDTNIPGYQFDLVRDNGEVLDPSGAAFVDRGYLDTHLDLPASERATRGTFIIDLLFGYGLDASEPGICDPAVCDPLSDHLAVWATLHAPL